MTFKQSGGNSKRGGRGGGGGRGRGGSRYARRSSGRGSSSPSDPSGVEKGSSHSYVKSSGVDRNSVSTGSVRALNSASSSNAAVGSSSGPKSAHVIPRKPTVRTKLILRRIPFHLTKEEVVDFILQHKCVREEHVFLFVQGKQRSGSRVPIPSRVYLNFKSDSEVVPTVMDALRTASLPDKNGVMIPLEIIYAPLQKLPREKPRRDPKAGSIHKDSDYKAFLESLEKPVEKLPSAEAQLNALETESTTTDKPLAPLVQYLLDKRLKKAMMREKSKARSKRGKLVKDKTILKKERKEKKKKIKKGDKKANKKGKDESKQGSKVLDNGDKDNSKPKGGMDNERSSVNQIATVKSVQPGMFRILPKSSSEKQDKGTKYGSNTEESGHSKGPKKKDKGGRGSGNGNAGGRGRGGRGGRGGRSDGGGRGRGRGRGQGRGPDREEGQFVAKKVRARKDSKSRQEYS